MGFWINVPPQEVAPHLCFLRISGALYPVAEDRHGKKAAIGLGFKCRYQPMWHSPLGLP